MKIKKIKVAIVDDSAFMRKIIRDSLEERGFDVVAIGRNGKDAVSIASKEIADVITLDVQMPVMDGLEALKTIMSTAPLPIIMVSSLTKKDAKITLEALSLGAFDFVAKPGGAISLDFSNVADELAEKIILATSYKPTLKKISKPPVSISYVERETGYDLVIIGASTGGPRALDNVIPRLPSQFPLPIIIVQHMPPKFTATLAKRLDEVSKIKVTEVTERTAARPKNVYVAMGDKHLEVAKNNGEIILAPVDGPKMNSVKPAVDYTLMSAAKLNLNVLSVILTGMGKDGTKGLKAFKRKRVTTIAESKNTAVVYGMPKSVVNEGLADYVLDLGDIPSKLVELV